MVDMSSVILNLDLKERNKHYVPIRPELTCDDFGLPSTFPRILLIVAAQPPLIFLRICAMIIRKI